MMATPARPNPNRPEPGGAEFSQRKDDMKYELRASDEPVLDFIEQLTEAGMPPYPIQEEAMLEWAASDGGLMLCVPTGSGKTLIAEAAIFEALVRKQRVFYTTPLVALTEQKFHEFRDRFGAENVGLVTGNKRVNGDAPLIVAVTEILTNRLLVPVDERKKHVCDVAIFDEFHYFSDKDRGWVWESAVLLLPRDVKIMMLSATMSKTVPFVAWLTSRRQREFKLIETTARAVPLTYVWCEELLEDAVELIIDRNLSPCLIFAFDRAGCFSTANQLTSLATGKLLTEDEQKQLQQELQAVDFNRGAGRRFRKLLYKGIGVHHAGVLPKWRHLVEDLFVRKLLKFVVCTETLAAGINLPARSVLLPELVKFSGGKTKQILDAATAKQIFGRAGRPQFDDKGYIYVLAPRDEVKIKNWEKRIAKLGRLPTKQELAKKPRREENAPRWNKDQFDKLVNADPPPLESYALPGYGALVFLLQEHELDEILSLIRRKFSSPQSVQSAMRRIATMLANLEALDYIETEPADPTAESADEIPLDDKGRPDPAGIFAKRRVGKINLDNRIVTALADDFENLLDFRGVHPLFGHWLSKRLKIGSFGEKLDVLEALTVQAKTQAGPEVDFDYLEHGPLFESVHARIGELLDRDVQKLRDEGAFEGKDEELVKRQRITPVPRFLAGKLLWEFDHLVAEPEPVHLQPKQIARLMIINKVDFFDFVERYDLEAQEGGVFRYLLRVVLLARQFFKLTDDPDYARMELEILNVVEPVDPSYLGEWRDEHGIENDEFFMQAVRKSLAAGESLASSLATAADVAGELAAKHAERMALKAAAEAAGADHPSTTTTAAADGDADYGSGDDYGDDDDDGDDTGDVDTGNHAIGG